MALHCVIDCYLMAHELSLLLVQACPPQGFPFYGLPPSMLAQLSLQHLQPQV